MKYSILLLLILYTSFAFGNTFKIGVNQPYSTPNQLYQANVIDHGDTIQIHGGTYTGNDALAHWNKDNLVILGIGDRPHLIADGAYILGKGIWVISGNNNRVSNIEFSGASVPDMNGAGIRLDGEGLTLVHCYFHHNENGLLTGNGGYLDISYCEFAFNGFGDGFSHNLYVNHIELLEFRFNYTHHANVGHCIKSRAKENRIIANRIMDEETGNSSRLIDISNGGISLIMGNLLMQGPQAENNNMIGYGLEGLSNPTDHVFFVVNNTFINKREASCRFLQVANDTETTWAYNNIFGGTGQIIDGNLDQDVGNLIETNIDALFLADESDYNYQLTSTSPAVDYGTTPPDPNVSNIILFPFLQYLHPTNGSIRPDFGPLDSGAYEYEPVMSDHEPELNSYVLHPNPTFDGVYISDKLIGYNYSLYSSQGHVLSEGFLEQGYFDLTRLNSGLYFFNFFQGKKSYTFKVLKH